MSVVLQHPQIEEQYLKCGSTMLLYKFFKIYHCRYCFVCFNTPMERESFLEMVPMCFFQVRCLSTWRPKTFASLTL